MNVQINANIALLLLKIAKSVTSNKSIIRFNNSFIYVESIVPTNNILRIRISEEEEINDSYEMDFLSFLTVIKTLLLKEPITIGRSANKLLIEFKSKNKVLRTGDFKIVKSPKKEFIGKYNFVDLTPELLNQIKIHTRNISYSNILTNLNGIFLVENYIYSTNAFSILRTVIETQVYNKDFENKNKIKPFSLGIFLPVHICSMINDLSGSNLRLMIDESENFVVCLSDLFEIAFPISTFEMEENIKPNIESVIESIQPDPLWNINIPALLLEVDPKLLQSMNPDQVNLEVKKHGMIVAFKANVGTSSAEFTSKLVVENISGKDDILVIATKELINCLNVGQSYANSRIRVDTDKTKVCFEFGNDEDTNNSLFIIALNEE
jgi:hypothetical protein